MNPNLAEEAANKIYRKQDKELLPLMPEEIKGIIQAAIEKAYRQGLNEGFGKGKQAGIRDTIAAHASEDERSYPIPATEGKE